MVAILLAFFFGCLGVHNFYLGYSGKGLVQLLISLTLGWAAGLGLYITGVWVLIEIVMIATGSIGRDAQGNPIT